MTEINWFKLTKAEYIQKKYGGKPRAIIPTAAGPACSWCGRGVNCWLGPDESPCSCVSWLVVHCKKEAYDVYIGRPSKWGNPFSHDGESNAPWLVDTRDQAVRMYREWITGQLDHHEQYRIAPKCCGFQRPTIEEIKAELQGKVLGCWCSPQLCHGLVLSKIANS